MDRLEGGDHAGSDLLRPPELTQPADRLIHPPVAARGQAFKTLSPLGLGIGGLLLIGLGVVVYSIRNGDPKPRILPSLELSGSITDKKGSPIANAKVTPLDHGNSVQSDAEGRFALKRDDSPAILRVERSGYVPTVIEAGASSEPLTLVLEQLPLGKKETP